MLPSHTHKNGAKVLLNLRLQSALLLSLIPYRRSVNLVFMFHLHTNCSGFVLPHLSVFLFFTRSLYSRSIFVYPCFSTGLTRYGWLKCERSPWLIHQLQIKHFLTQFSRHICFKALWIFYRSEVDLHLHTVHSTLLPASTLPLLVLGCWLL